MRWPVALLALAMAAGCATPDGPDDGAADGSARTTEALGRAWDHLLTVRGTDGWPAGLAPYLVEAAVADGRDPGGWPPGGPLLQEVRWPPEDAPYLSTLRPLHAFALAGHRATDVESRILSGWDGRQFGDPMLLNDDAYAILALRGAVGPTDDRWPTWTASLAANQSADGGWSWSVDGAGETDMAGIVLAALRPADSGATVDQDAAASFLASTRTSDGGHSMTPSGAEGNCDSTVWALRAFALLDPAALARAGVDDRHLDAAWDFLFGLEVPGGGYAHQRGGESNLLCTVEVAALLGDGVHGRVPGPPASA